MVSESSSFADGLGENFNLRGYLPPAVFLEFEFGREI
jgi:hypothetical protein